MLGVSLQGSRPKILIADDHAIFAEALRVYLEKILYFQRRTRLMFGEQT